MEGKWIERVGLNERVELIESVVFSG